MDMNLRRGALCDRARAWAALAPDGELSELERKLLAAHVARCQACEAFAADVEAVARTLRQERLETLSHPIAIPLWRRRAGYGHVRVVGAAAAVALMAIGITARAPLPSNERDPLRLPRVTNFSNDAEGEVAQISRAQGGPTGIARLRPGRQGVGQPL
jgi:ferric-dicitrate binding protein FerR (iron transport regulator)